MQSTRLPTQQGFTLIEIILALALTALLLSLLSAGTYAVMSDWDRDSKVLDERLDETIALLQIERAIKGAFAHSYRDESSLGRYIYFEGDDDVLRWVSTVSPQRDSGLMAWQLESRGDEGVYVSLAPALSDSPEQRLEDAEATVLLPNYQASFSYLYEELDFRKEWRDEWLGSEQNALPLAVYILLEPINGSQREPIELVAQIKANTHRSIRATTSSGSGTPATRNTPFGGL
ncbi:MAG: prepilin-type N-terminal cleavage/methylation domain-containing protein [Pseudohongiellaceae bacterium]|nr:prepilin-type N-terminal cleavage/methylation domain-containing protein [Pseudohongiellaceae bacterium]